MNKSLNLQPPMAELKTCHRRFYYIAVCKIRYTKVADFNFLIGTIDKFSKQ